MTHNCPSEWMKTKTTDVIICTFAEGYVAKTHQMKPVSSLADISNCQYETGYCFDTDRKIAVSFVPNSQVNEDYILIGKYNATVIANHYALPAET